MNPRTLISLLASILKVTTPRGSLNKADFFKSVGVAAISAATATGLFVALIAFPAVFIAELVKAPVLQDRWPILVLPLAQALITELIRRWNTPGPDQGEAPAPARGPAQ